MQKIIILFAAIVLVASCSQKPKTDFAVKVTLKNAPAGQTLYLEKFAFTSTTNQVLDSIKLKTSGEYTLDGKGTEEGLYLLTVNHNPAVILINDNPVININLDYQSTHNPVFDGSPTSNNLYSFINYYLPHDSLLHAISEKIDTLSKINPADSSIQMLNMLGMREMKLLNDKIASIAETSTSPALVCFVLDRARNTMELADIDSLVIKASAKFKQHSGLAIIKSQVAQALTYQQQQNPSTPSYPLLNKQAPDLVMAGIDGKQLSISSFRGKYLLVDFWASWCGPCRGENPNVVAAYNKYKDKNFTILGVSLDQNKAAWQEAVKKDGLAWNQMSDLKYWSSAAVGTYQFDGIPFNVLIDPSGKIIASSLRGPELEQKLAELLK